ncbi:uncharacterized protein FFB14_15836 [Fusarium fujikuroi]|nr:uncharacterized protein FFB14_15836 [Fusarium fujikuroi]
MQLKIAILIRFNRLLNKKGLIGQL